MDDGDEALSGEMNAGMIVDRWDGV